MNLEKLLKENERRTVEFMKRLMMWTYHDWLVWEYAPNSFYVELYKGDDFNTAFSIWSKQNKSGEMIE